MYAHIAAATLFIKALGKTGDRKTRRARAGNGILAKRTRHAVGNTDLDLQVLGNAFEYEVRFAHAFFE